MNLKKFSMMILNKSVKHAATNSANSTTSGALYQPKAPAELKNLSKIEK